MKNENNFFLELSYISEYMWMINDDIERIREWHSPIMHEDYVSEKLMCMKRMIHDCWWFDNFIDTIDKTIRKDCEYYFNPNDK